MYSILANRDWCRPTMMGDRKRLGKPISRRVRRHWIGWRAPRRQIFLSQDEYTVIG